MTHSSFRSLVHASIPGRSTFGFSASSTSPASGAVRTRDSRASLSPVRRLSAQRRLPPAAGLARFVSPGRADSHWPTADSITPPTPSLIGRWWNPHLVDRLQTPLSRIRE